MEQAQESGLLPEAPPSSLGGSFSSQAARGAANVVQQHRQAKSSGGVMIALPNGTLGNLEDDPMFLEHVYLAGRHRSIFGEAHELLRDPTPGCVFVWAAKWNPKGDKLNAQTLARVRGRHYRVVEITEIRDDTDLPVEEATFAGVKGVLMGDCVLMEVSPQAQRDLYKWPAFEAKRRTNRWQSFEELQQRVSQLTDGKAYAEVAAKR